jgi:hypothetical protein
VFVAVEEFQMAFYGFHIAATRRPGLRFCG